MKTFRLFHAHLPHVLHSKYGVCMTIKRSLNKLADMLDDRQRPLLRFDASQQESYMNSLGSPSNDIERSFCQYKCQMKLKGKPLCFLINLASLPLALFYLIKAKPISRADSVHKRPCNNRNSACIVGGVSDSLIPDILRQGFSSFSYCAEYQDVLSSSDRHLIATLIRIHPLSWHFVFKCLLKTMQYRSAVDSNAPDALIVSDEYSFTSSVMSWHFENEGVELINVMHGEKLFYMRDSFFRFSRCYVWSDTFRQLFIKLRADEDQFIIAIPKALAFQPNKICVKKYDYAYYFARETESSVQAISSLLLRLKACGARVKVRPHPRWFDEIAEDSALSGLDIEDPSLVPIEESIIESVAVIARYSTVLRQACMNGIRIVIDDCSDPEIFGRLVDLQYSILDESHTLFSDELKRVVNY